MPVRTHKAIRDAGTRTERSVSQRSARRAPMQTQAGETVKITGLTTVDAFYSNGYWDFDLYTNVDEKYQVLPPEVFFMANEESTGNTKIAGTWSVYAVNYVISATDTVSSPEKNPIGYITFACVGKNTYDVYGYFVGEDGKTYTWDIQDVEVWAWNSDEKQEITLTDIQPTGNTIALQNLDAIDLAWYPSYSKDGAYNYNMSLYNSTNTYPILQLDIFTATRDVFSGSYSAASGNIGTYYSVYVAAKEIAEVYFVDINLTITKVGDALKVEGSAMGMDGNQYTFSVTSANLNIHDAEYPYEPADPQSLSFTVDSIVIDNQYVASYGELDYYIYMHDGTYIMLYFNTENTSLTALADGTYTFSYEEEYEHFLPGYFESNFGFPMASIYIDNANNYYYLQTGTVTISTVGGTTTLTLAATSGHGTQFNVSGTIKNATGLVETLGDNIQSTRKLFNNGMLYILRDGNLFDAQGNRVE